MQTNDDAEDERLDVGDLVDDDAEECNMSDDEQAESDQAVDEEDCRSALAVITNTCVSSGGRMCGRKRTRSEFVEDSAESDENAGYMTRARKKRRRNKKQGS